MDSYIILYLIYFPIGFIFAFLLRIHAAKYGYKKNLWFWLTVVAWPIIIFIYNNYRIKHTIKKKCPHCGELYAVNTANKYCPLCGGNLKGQKTTTKSKRKKKSS